THARVTTTGSLDGWRISQYLGVVSTSIVAGTGLWTEWLAGWTDIFGGRSRAFKNQLETLHHEAIAQLLQKANALGADWLIGLHLHNDDVSEKNMKMFMVPAHATAVKAALTTASERVERPVTVDTDDVRVSARRLELLQYGKEHRLYFSDEIWQFAIEQQFL